MAEQVYKRRLSGEEADRQYIFITKDMLNKFPPSDTKFNLSFDNQGFEAVIAAVSCDCIGTQHEHYHLKVDELFRQGDLKKGTHVALYKIDANNYLLEASE